MTTTPKRKIAIVTVGRSDFSILRPLANLLNETDEFDVGYWVGGAHFEETSGRTVEFVRKSGVPIWFEHEAAEQTRDAFGVATSIGNEVKGFAAAVTPDNRPDLVVILGDRYEAVAVGLALIPFNIPVCHISGGSVTEGAIDDTFRHCLTKMSTLHFCDVPDFARRIHRMGERPDRIFAVGALGLDGVGAVEPKPFADLIAHFDLQLDADEEFILVTLHPETRAPELTSEMAKNMVAALEQTGRQVIYTYPNADPERDVIIAEIEDAARRNDNHVVVRNFGPDWFNTAMRHAALMVGNSSGGIIEAASFGMPVVDIGDRQKGRYHGENVLHCGIGEAEIRDEIAKASRAEFRDTVSRMTNPYGDGKAARRVISEFKKLDWASLDAPKIFADFDPNYSGEYEGSL